jgi:cholesterol oxidase
MMASYDAIVVGSGFGGGIAACRMAEAGASVCVLERGRRFGRDDFVERPEQAAELLWHRSANPGGMYDVRLMRDIVVITAAGVGGGSLVYANVQLRAPAAVFETGWPAAITRPGLDPWYDKTEEALDPQTTPDTPALDKVRAFAAAGAHAGKDAIRLPLAVHFGAARANPFSGLPQGGCENLGRCDIGCPVHAKNTVDITYLARAEQHGAEIRPLHLVTAIEPPRAPGGHWRLSFEHLGEGRDGSVEAPLVILAAGTLGTPRLLLTNRRRLPGLSPALGTRFSGNGDALGLAFDPQAPDVRAVRNDVGPVMTSALDYTADRHLIAADGGLPPGFEGILDVARGVSVIDGWRRWLVRARDALVHLGLSDQSLHPRELALQPRHSNANSLILLMIGRDAADGRMRLTPLLRRLDIRWDQAASAALFADLERTFRDVAAAAQATPYFALEAGPLSKFTTVHPLGGCPMAEDPARGVVDDVGRVHGHPGLRVLDGSIVPTALGVNPSKTIAALAERGVAQLVAEGA